MMIQNRRKFGRIDAQRCACVINLHGNQTDGVLIDESIGGLRVGGVALLHLFVDQEIAVEYYDDTVLGRCRSVERCEDGLFEIGVLRDLDPDQASLTSSLVNTFMDFDGRVIACVPKTIVDQTLVTICLPGGREFTVPKTILTQLTREERSKQLLDSTVCQQASEVYTAIYNQAAFEDRQAILLHEFGPKLDPKTG